MAFYVLDNNNNYVESMSKEEILAAIQTAAAGGDFKGFGNVAFVSKVKELNKNAAFGFWVGTQAEYNAITTKEKNVLYLISDDPLCNDLPNKVAAAVTAIDEIELKLEGYDKTEAALVKSAEETAQAVEGLTTAFSEVNKNFAAAQAEFKESQNAYTNMQLSNNAMQQEYERAAKIETLFESAEGATYIERTTRPVTDFKEICIIYKMDTDASLSSAFKNQKRVFVADLDEYVHINETMACNSRVDEDAITVGARVRITALNPGTSTHASRLSVSEIAASISGQNPTCKIYKIYGIGEVV